MERVPTDGVPNICHELCTPPVYLLPGLRRGHEVAREMQPNQGMLRFAPFDLRRVWYFGIDAASILRAPTPLAPGCAFVTKFRYWSVRYRNQYLRSTLRSTVQPGIEANRDSYVNPYYPDALRLHIVQPWNVTLHGQLLPRVLGFSRSFCCEVYHRERFVAIVSRGRRRLPSVTLRTTGPGSARVREAAIPR